MQCRQRGGIPRLTTHLARTGDDSGQRACEEGEVSGAGAQCGQDTVGATASDGQLRFGQRGHDGLVELVWFHGNVTLVTVSWRDCRQLRQRPR
jgi:hypothetical protein